MQAAAKPTPNNVEHTFNDDTFLVSKTNPRGIITYANTTFIEISGYTEAELLNQPHCMIRHPDMPKAAFKDLWTTVQSGKEWHGLVKNLRKDGGYYWVDATVTPSFLDGKIVGYMSVRRNPSRAQIEKAETLYRKLRAEEHGTN